MLLIVYNQIHIQCSVSALHLYASNSLTFHEIFSHQESCDCMLLNPYQECTIEAEFIVKRGEFRNKYANLRIFKFLYLKNQEE